VSHSHIQTKSLTLVLQTPEDVRAWVAGLDAAIKSEISADWLARLDASTEADPWVHGFVLVHRATETVIGRAGFKGPPGADGAVEVAYGVAPEHEGKGYATEAAEALTAFALKSGQVRVVRAHTLPQKNASGRILTKCGFKFIGEVIEPDDGLVWRWEKENQIQNSKLKIED
jgi:[ribosomal protein S5]-alanine N-acetyltransferase